MEMKKQKLDDNLMEHVIGGIATPPTADSICPQCGCKKAWAKPTEDRGIVYKCPICGLEYNG